MRSLNLDVSNGRSEASCDVVARHLADFAVVLNGEGFSQLSIEEHVRQIAHLTRWAERRSIPIVSFNDGIAGRFRRHLVCCKRYPNKGVFRHAVPAITRWLAYLRRQGLVPPAPAAKDDNPPISRQFAEWTLRHRGLVNRTMQRHQHYLRPFFDALGENPSKFTVSGIRQFVVGNLKKRGRAEARFVVTAIRAFLRYLVAEGRLPAEMVDCVPTVPQWRLSSLPRYLDLTDVQRVIESCDLSKAHGLRDRAVLLLLARLGLRSGDIVRLTFEDIDWEHGTIRLLGKSRREVLLPLPQDVGDALLAYIEHGRRKCPSNHIFLAANAPTRPFTSSVAVCDIVRLALARAEIENPPSRGAHLLRHSAATAMLRAGGSLDAIAAVLRHQSTDTTAQYAKIDVTALAQIAQPWPGGASC